MKAVAGHTIDTHIYLGAELPLTARIILFVSTLKKGWYGSYEVLAEIVGCERSALKQAIRRLVQRGSLERRSDNRGTSLHVAIPETAVTDRQLAALSGISQRCRYVRRSEVADAQAALDAEHAAERAGRAWPAIYLAAPERVAGGLEEAELWGTARTAARQIEALRGLLHLQEDGAKKFWSFLARNIKKNPRLRGHPTALACQVGLLALASHLVAKGYLRRPIEARSPGAWLGTLLARLDPSKDVGTWPDPAAVRRDMARLHRAGVLTLEDHRQRLAPDPDGGEEPAHPAPSPRSSEVVQTPDGGMQMPELTVVSDVESDAEVYDPAWDEDEVPEDEEHEPTYMGMVRRLRADQDARLAPACEPLPTPPSREVARMRGSLYREGLPEAPATAIEAGLDLYRAGRHSWQECVMHAVAVAVELEETAGVGSPGRP